VRKATQLHVQIRVQPFPTVCKVGCKWALHRTNSAGQSQLEGARDGAPPASASVGQPTFPRCGWLLAESGSYEVALATKHGI
jgi:hypothetical protein